MIYMAQITPSDLIGMFTSAVELIDKVKEYLQML